MTWGLIVALTVADCLNAWVNRDTFLSWEISPLACWLYNAGGIYLTIGARVGTVAFGMLMAAIARPLAIRIAYATLGASVAISTGQVLCLFCH